MRREIEKRVESGEAKNGPEHETHAGSKFRELGRHDLGRFTDDFPLGRMTQGLGRDSCQ